VLRPTVRAKRPLEIRLRDGLGCAAKEDPNEELQCEVHHCQAARREQGAWRATCSSG
jgi:hypothetical protein